MRKRAMGSDFTIRKSDGVKVYHERKSDGGDLTMRKKAMG